VAKNRPPCAPAPGELLRAKRLENDWPAAEVACALCLAERQLRALEADDYAALPGRAYILGYWQNYANLLGLADDAGLAAAVESHKSRLAQQGAGLALRAESRRAHGVLEVARRRWALAFGALAAVFIASTWLWRGGDDGFSLALPGWPAAEWRRWPGADSPPPAPAQNGAATVATVADASVLPEPNFPDVTVADESTDGTVIDATVTDATVADATVTDADADATVADATAPALRTAGVTGRATAGVTVDATVTDATVTDATVTNATVTDVTVADESTAATVTDTTAPDQLILSVRAASWVEVGDADGRELLRQNVAPDSRLTLRGSPPFAVYIGNPAAVSVQYRGRPVAFAADGRFARFSVGGQ